ncbi:hypothetical protein [Georgenia sp. SYP-B2076]|uniref:hypothetical protein n=1 Tax=Georgenia sp. SYP-B2076 TaxID=2495881 RepID=UPI000F8D31DA|nr:hypothetical protein [Georgenia sp. SYP-B2076]
MSMRRDKWRRPAALAAVTAPAALAVLVLAPMLLALLSGLATIHACVPAPGAWAQAGLRLAVLRPDEACPDGTLAVGAAGQAITLVVAVAVPVMLAQLVLLGGTAALVGAAHAVIAAAARHLVARIAPGAPVSLTPQPRLGVADARPAPARRIQDQRPHRRGPPVLLGAVG